MPNGAAAGEGAGLVSIVEERGPGLSPPQVRVAGYAVAALATVAGGAALFVVDPVLTALAIALVLAAVAAPIWTPELFEITTRSRGRTSRGINPVFLVPPLLTFFAALRNDFVSVQPLWLAAGAGATIAGLAAWARRRRPGVAGPIQLVCLAAMTGGGLGLSAPGLIDVRFDAAPAQPYQAAIASMYIAHG